MCKVHSVWRRVVEDGAKRLSKCISTFEPLDCESSRSLPPVSLTRPSTKLLFLEAVKTHCGVGVKKSLISHQNSIKLLHASLPFLSLTWAWGRVGGGEEGGRCRPQSPERARIGKWIKERADAAPRQREAAAVRKVCCRARGSATQPNFCRPSRQEAHVASNRGQKNYACTHSKSSSRTSNIKMRKINVGLGRGPPAVARSRVSALGRAWARARALAGRRAVARGSGRQPSCWGSRWQWGWERRGCLAELIRQ